MDKVISAAPAQAGLNHLIAAAALCSVALLRAVPNKSVGTRLNKTSVRIFQMAVASLQIAPNPKAQCLVVHST
jgi:hypothetical protein